MNPSRAAAGGFTLIELLIVVGIVGLLAATFLPDLLAGKETANIEADAANMRQQAQWLEIAQSPAKLGGLPTEGGHAFLLTLWTKDVIDHSPENFDRFFTPGVRENEDYYKNLRQQVLHGEKIWTDLRLTTAEDTHYAARAKQYLRGMVDFKEAWVANDNDGGWAFKSGVVNVLWGNGSTRPINLEEMKQYGLVDKDTEVFKTYGPDSPHPALKKLDN